MQKIQPHISKYKETLLLLRQGFFVFYFPEFLKELEPVTYLEPTLHKAFSTLVKAVDPIEICETKTKFEAKIHVCIGVDV